MAHLQCRTRDSDPDPGTDIHPKNGHSSDRGSKSGCMQWEHFLYSAMYPSGT